MVEVLAHFWGVASSSGGISGTDGTDGADTAGGIVGADGADGAGSTSSAGGSELLMVDCWCWRGCWQECWRGCWRGYSIALPDLAESILA